MRKSLFILLLLLVPLTGSAQEPSGREEPQPLFHTSVCYDLLASFDRMEKLLDVPQFAPLTADSLFTARAARIGEELRPSQLCNWYSTTAASKESPAEVVESLRTFDPAALPAKWQGEWLEKICSLRHELIYCLEKLIEADYATHWHTVIQPELQRQIAAYRVDPAFMSAVHDELLRMAGDQPLGTATSRIYILDLQNTAFALLDGSFACIPQLLDPAVAHQYRIDFLQVYIHENLHRLPLSPELMARLEHLYENDPFYRDHEERARGFGEGKNEAFVVAAERFVSRRLGRIDDRAVVEEFLRYVDGTLVLAPIIYLRLDEQRAGESFDAFLCRLMDRDLRPGRIGKLYHRAIEKLNRRLFKEQKNE